MDFVSVRLSLLNFVQVPGIRWTIEIRKVVSKNIFYKESCGWKNTTQRVNICEEIPKLIMTKKIPRPGWIVIYVSSGVLFLRQVWSL